MSRLVIGVTLALVALVGFGLDSVEGTTRVLLRGYGMNGQYYEGSGVGPLWLFRSSADNYAIVKEGLRGHPIQRSFAYALGDEFPRLRDDLIARAKEGSRYGAGSGSSSGSGTGSSTDDNTADSDLTPSVAPSSARSSALSSFTNFQNWRFDRENAKNEINNPYKRSNPLSSVISAAGSLGGGSGGSGGLLSRVTGLFGNRGSSSSGEGGSSGSGGFKISIDSPTRAPDTV